MAAESDGSRRSGTEASLPVDGADSDFAERSQHSVSRRGGGFQDNGWRNELGGHQRRLDKK